MGRTLGVGFAHAMLTGNYAILPQCKNVPKTLAGSDMPWQEPANLALLQDSFFAYQSLVEPPELEPLSILIIPWPSLASAAANPRRAAASRRYPSLHQPLDSRRLWCLADAMQLCVSTSCAPAQCMRRTKLLWQLMATFAALATASRPLAVCL